MDGLGKEKYFLQGVQKKEAERPRKYQKKMKGRRMTVSCELDDKGKTSFVKKGQKWTN